MFRLADKLYDFLFCLLICVLPYSLKLPNILLLGLLLLFVADYKNLTRLNYSRLMTLPMAIFAAFALYLWIKALITGTIQEAKYDLLLLILVMPVLFVKVKNTQNLIFFVVLSGLLLIIPASYRLGLFYTVNHQVLPFEGLSINAILGMERPYLGFFIVCSILASVYLSVKWFRYRLFFYGYTAIASIFVFYISARIAAGTLLIVAALYFSCYYKTALKNKLAALTLVTVAVLALLSLNRNLRERFFISGNTESSLAKFERHEPRVIIWPCAFEVMQAPEHNFSFGLVSEERLDTLMTRCYDRTITNRHRANFFVKSTLNTHNQWFNIYITSGAIGLLLIILFFMSVLGTYRTSYISTALALAMFLFFCVENVLHRQLGAYYFALILSFITLHQEPPALNSKVK